MKNLVIGMILGIVFTVASIFFSATADGEELDTSVYYPGMPVVMYVACDNQEDAETLFDLANKHDGKKWTAMVEDPQSRCMLANQAGLDHFEGKLIERLTYSAEHELWRVEDAAGDVIYSYFKRIYTKDLGEEI